MITHQKNPHITKWFTWIAKRSMAKSFRRISVTKASPEPKFVEGVPVIGVMNHSSWWDALTATYLAVDVFKRDGYGIFAAEQLRRYGIFRKVGGFGIDRESPAEWKEFLRYCEKLLEGTSRLLWIYPQGEIMSNDVLPLQFKKGFASVAARLTRVQLMKVTVSYDFWLDSKPEIVMDFLPVEMVTPSRSATFADELSERVSAEMTSRLMTLKEIVKKRDHSQLCTIISAEAGAHPMYDFYRRIQARIKGEKFNASHSAD